jgi:hypothetical protein
MSYMYVRSLEGILLEENVMPCKIFCSRKILEFLLKRCISFANVAFVAFIEWDHVCVYTYNMYACIEYICMYCVIKWKKEANMILVVSLL